jgi:hypothetical protein
MNNTITAQSSNSSAATVERFLVPITAFNLITNVYSLPIVSVIGFILNIPCLIVLFHRKLKGDTYKYLIFKTIIHLSFLFIMAISATYRCTSCPFTLSLFTKIAQYYLHMCVLIPLSTYVALVEIALSYDRLLMLKQQKSKYLIKLSFWPATIAFIVLGLVVNVPFMMAFRIQQLPGTDIWLYLPTDFFHTTFYRMYAIVFNVFQALLALVVLVVLNIFVKIEFSNYMKRKKNLTSNSRSVYRMTNINSKAKSNMVGPSEGDTNLNSKEENISAKETSIKKNNGKDQNESAELNFTLMILVASVLFSVTRLFQFINIGSFMIFQQLGITSPFSQYISFLSWLSAIVYYGSNIFNYFHFNKVFRGCFREIFHF